MDQLTRMLAGLLRCMAGLLGEHRRDWVHALLAETDGQPHQPRAAARKLRLSGVHLEDFDLASCYTAAFDPRVGGDQGDVEGFGQGDILSVVGGQVGMKALQARP